MATSPHQRETLSDKITRLKVDLEEKRALRSQIQTLGQSTAAGGVSTTYADLPRLEAAISQLEAKIDALIDQLTGDTASLQPGVNLLSHRSEY